MCEGTYLPATETQDYLKKALAEKRTDQQVRDVDIGRAHIGIGVVHRGKLDAPAPNSVAEHDLVSDVCTENSIRVDHVSESPNVGNDDRAVLPLPGLVRLAVQVEEPT
jgi:hypothetical protein